MALVAVPGAIVGIYTSAVIEYNKADSTIISTALRGCRVAPGRRVTFKIRMDMKRVQRTVVATESDMDVMSMSTGSSTPPGGEGESQRPVKVIAVAEVNDLSFPVYPA